MLRNLLLLILFFAQGMMGQVSGEVLSGTTGVAGARVQIKQKGNVVDYKFTDLNGIFVFTVVGDSLTLEVSHLGYEKYSLLLPKTPAKNLEIRLTPRAESLQEVVIENKLPIRQKKDTIVYNPEAFRDGSERVLEDLLKKLPGVDVADDGKLSYKGREISALMLDGDDLFKNRYRVGSKNLDVDAVQSVEAIDNFNNDKVLHQITRTKSVALNIKLKEGLASFSLEANLNNDFHSRYNNALTGLTLAPKIKGFSTAAMNNTGLDNSIGITTDVDTGRRAAPMLVSEGGFRKLQSAPSLFNNTLGTSQSFMYSFSERLKSSIIADVVKDRFSQDLFSSTRYNLDGSEVTYVNTDRQIRRPVMVSLGNDWEFYNGDDTQVFSGISYSNRRADYQNDATNNGVRTAVQTDSRLEHVRWYGSISHRVASGKALKIRPDFMYTETVQQLDLLPPLEVDPTLTFRRQDVNSRQRQFFNTVEYHQGGKWNLILKNISGFSGEHLITNLAFTGDPSSDLSNDVTMSSFFNEFKAKATVKGKRWETTVEPSIFFSDMEVFGRKNIDRYLLINGGFEYRVRRKHSADFKVEQRVDLPLISQVFRNPVLTSYRSATSNEGDFGSIKSTSYAIGYTISDFYNTFYFNTVVRYGSRNRNYFYNHTVTPTVIYDSQLLLSFGDEQFEYNITTHKFIPFLRLNARFFGSASRTNSFNFISLGDLRSVTADYYSGNLNLSTARRQGINVQNSIQMSISRFSAQGFTNELTQFQNEATITYKWKEKIQAQTKLLTILPDTKADVAYNFLTFEVLYKPEKINCEFTLTGLNLLNHKTLTEYRISDYTVSSSSQNLQERMILLGLRFKLI